MAEVNWTDAQLEAIDSGNSNILVSAAAGSGKTAVLVERVIRMITREEDPADIDSLLVVTFTRAAARQMKSKIYKALRERLDADPANRHIRDQLMKVQGAKICTIDSLCLDIVRDNFQDIDLDPGFRMADETEIRMIRKDVLSAVIEEMYQEGSPDFLELAQYYTDKNDSKLEEITATLYDYASSHPEPVAWLDGCCLPYTEAQNMYADEEDVPEPEGYNDWKDDFVAIIAGRLDEIYDMAAEGLKVSEMNYGPYPLADSFRDIMNFITDLEDQSYDYRVSAINAYLDGWTSAPRVSTKDGTVDEGLKKYASGLRTKIKGKLISLRDDYLYDDLEGIYGEIASCTNIAVAITDLTKRFIERFSEAKKEKVIADFSDIAHYALQILICYDENGRIIKDENDNPVYTRTADLMAQSIREVIVDEYQDTNMLQEYLVKALSGERFGRPNVFMVGDVKQSIYGFRMACPELFIDKYNTFGAEGNGFGKLINLDRNFRSRKEILDFTNLVFRQSMIEKIGGINYLNGHGLVYGEAYGPADPEAEKIKTEMLMIQGSGEQVKNIEAYSIARKIEELVSEGEYNLSDIVILTRTTDNPELERTLYERGIPVINNSGRGFFDSFEIRLVMDLLKIIDNPRQDIPLAAVLYSPVCSATPSDLAKIRNAGDSKDSLYDCLVKYCGGGDAGNGDIAAEAAGDCDDVVCGATDAADAGNRAELSECEGPGRFSGFLAKLEGWRQKSVIMGIYDFIKYVLSDSGLDNILLAMPQGEQRKANIDFLMSKALSFARGSYSGLFSFIRYIRELQESDVDFGQAAVNGAGSHAVRMMTIHRSKGLEFPVVFLACSGKKYNETDVNSSIVLDRKLGIGLEKRDITDRMIRRTALMQTIRQKQKEETYAEEMRLLYVAMTRAKEKLIITGTSHQLSSKIDSWELERDAGDGPLKPYKILSSDNYMFLLGLCLYKYKDSNDLFTLILEDELEIEEQRAGEAADNTARIEALENLMLADIDFSDVKEQCDYYYPYLNAATIQQKITASQLEDKDIKEQDYTRSAVQHKGSLTGAERGNAYHRFFQLTDYSSDIEGQLERFEAEGLMSREYAGSIEPDYVQGFYSSGVGSRMAAAHKAGNLYREKPFVMGSIMDVNHERALTSTRFYESDVPDDELLLVQGIIDAYFIEEDAAGNRSIILVDYKTDTIIEEEWYIRKYKPQLDAYAAALTGSTGIPVTEKIIYSVELGREIKLP